MHSKFNATRVQGLRNLKHHSLQLRDTHHLCSPLLHFQPGQIGLTWNGNRLIPHGLFTNRVLPLRITASLSPFGTNGLQSISREPQFVRIGLLPYSLSCKLGEIWHPLCIDAPISVLLFGSFVISPSLCSLKPGPMSRTSIVSVLNNDQIHWQNIYSNVLQYIVIYYNIP